MNRVIGLGDLPDPGWPEGYQGSLPSGAFDEQQMLEFGRACYDMGRADAARIADEFRKGAGDSVCGQVAAAIRKGTP
jgi:hypothetical protein